jgi:hypothetical protein
MGRRQDLLKELEIFVQEKIQFLDNNFKRYTTKGGVTGGDLSYASWHDPSQKNLAQAVYNSDGTLASINFARGGGSLPDGPSSITFRGSNDPTVLWYHPNGTLRYFYGGLPPVGLTFEMFRNPNTRQAAWEALGEHVISDSRKKWDRADRKRLVQDKAMLVVQLKSLSRRMEAIELQQFVEETLKLIQIQEVYE